MHLAKTKGTKSSLYLKVRHGLGLADIWRAFVLLSDHVVESWQCHSNPRQQNLVCSLGRRSIYFPLSITETLANHGHLCELMYEDVGRWHFPPSMLRPTRWCTMSRKLKWKLASDQSGRNLKTKNKWSIFVNKFIYKMITVNWNVAKHEKITHFDSSCDVKEKVVRDTITSRAWLRLGKYFERSIWAGEKLRRYIWWPFEEHKKENQHVFCTCVDRKALHDPLIHINQNHGHSLGPWRITAVCSVSDHLLAAPLVSGSVLACSASPQNAYPPSAEPGHAGPPPPQRTDLMEDGGERQTQRASNSEQLDEQRKI